MPRISVIVPVYKVEPYIHRCVDSILAQTFTDFELILVDDGSPDACGTICDEYAVKDRRIHVIHQENGGLSAARNAAIDWTFANSDSQWLSFVDSDDWVHPKYLEMLFCAAMKYGTRISECVYFLTDGTKELPQPGEKMLCIPPEDVYLDWDLPFAWCKLYAKQCFEELRYPVGKLYEDEAIWCKLLFSQEKISIVSEWLYYYYQRPESILNSDWKPAKLSQIEYLEDQLRFLSNHADQRVRIHSEERLFRYLSEHITRIPESHAISEEEKKKYSRQVRRKLRQYFFRYYNNPYLAENRRHFWLLCFPILGKVNRIIKIARN